MKLVSKINLKYIIVFSILFIFTGAVGRQFHASAISVLIITSGVIVLVRGVSIKDIIVFQLPIIVVAILIIILNELYANLPIIVFSLISISVVFCIHYIRYKWYLFSMFIVLVPSLAYYFTVHWLFIRANESGSNHPIQFPELIILNEDLTIFDFPFDNTLYVIDVWSSNCGGCFKKMPEIEELSLKYKDNNGVKFLLLNLPIAQDTIGEASQNLKKRNIQLKSLYAKDLYSWDSLKIEGVPVYLFVKNRKILEVHNGGGTEVLNSNFKPSLEKSIAQALRDY